MVVTLSMLLGICATNTAFAARTPAKIGTTALRQEVPLNSDDESYGVLYMEDGTVGATYRASDFLWSGESTQTVTALAYPPARRTSSQRTVGDDAFPEQDGSIKKENAFVEQRYGYTLVSSGTGVRYQLPIRNGHSATKLANGEYHFAKEILMLDHKARKSTGVPGVQTAIEIDINKRLSRLDLLIGSAQLAGNYNKLIAFVTYEDGTTSLPEGFKMPSDAGTSTATFNDSCWADVSNPETDPTSRNNEYIYSSVMQAKASDQRSSNFVADLQTYTYTREVQGTEDLAGNSEGMTFAFTKNTTVDSPNTIAAYEYGMKLDPMKKVSKLTIAAGDSGAGRSGFAVLAITGSEYAPIHSDEDITLPTNGRLFITEEEKTAASSKFAISSDFIGGGYKSGNKLVAVKWPLENPSTDVDATTNIVPKATVSTDGDTATITSFKTGKKYSVKKGDVILLDGRRTVEGYTLPSKTEVDLPDAAYNKISFLTTHTCFNESPDAIKAYVQYTDGTTSLPTDLVEDEVGTIETMSGNGGYIYGNMPKCYGGEITNGAAGVKAKGFLMRLSTYATISTNVNYINYPTYTFGGDAQYYAMLYEHVLTVDPTKMVDKIYFENIPKGTTEYIEGIAIVSIHADPVFVANTATVANGSCTVRAYTNVAGDVYAAIYEGGKLVATQAADAGADTIQDIVIEDADISTAKNYDIKLFVWATDGSFKPLTTPLTDSHAAQ